MALQWEMRDPRPPSRVMSVVRVDCDRCGAEDIGTRHSLMMSAFGRVAFHAVGSGSMIYERDLCSQCTDELREWLAERGRPDAGNPVVIGRR